MARLVLGSGSPRRRELLGHLGLPFEVISPDVDETEQTNEDPVAYVERVAGDKAAAVVAAVGADAVVIAADTTVEIDGQILAKPVDEPDARRMIGLLQGRVHRVHTAVVVRTGARIERATVTTEVEFAPMSAERIAWYVATGEPFDKAGGYAIQGVGGLFVAEIRGSVSNVVGLPMAQLVELLTAVGAVGPDLRR